MTFKTIETQEELDAIIGERLKREREAAEKKYAGFDEAKEKAGKYDALIAKDLDGQIAKLTADLKAEREKNAAHDETVSALTTRAVKAEGDLLRVKIAHEIGIPFELAERLKGDDEEALRKDAETLSGYVAKNSTPPLRTTERTPNGNGKADNTEAFYALAAALTENQ